MDAFLTSLNLTAGCPSFSCAGMRVPEQACTGRKILALPLQLETHHQHAQTNTSSGLVRVTRPGSSQSSMFHAGYHGLGNPASSTSALLVGLAVRSFTGCGETGLGRVHFRAHEELRVRSTSIRSASIAGQSWMRSRVTMRIGCYPWRTNRWSSR